MTTIVNVEKLDHHEQQPLCLTRPAYRQGRKLTAVKVYTVNDESQYLIVQGVPAINLSQELEALCQHFGELDSAQHLAQYPSEAFTHTFLLKYRHIRRARLAKKQLDGRSFYGGVLHVCYAPELESMEETRQKLEERRRAVAAFTRHLQDPTTLIPIHCPRITSRAGQLVSQLKQSQQQVPLHPWVAGDKIQEGPSDSPSSHPEVQDTGRTMHTEEGTGAWLGESGTTQKPLVIPVTSHSNKRLPEPLVLSGKKKIKVFKSKSLLSFNGSGE